MFRILAVAMAAYLLQWRIVKLLGGGYLIFIAVKHLFFESKEQQEEVLSVDAAGEPQLRLASGGPLSPNRNWWKFRNASRFRSLKISSSRSRNSPGN
ncbi:MAG UNVERIFIED_CONTAM: hypothetical protein LVR18_08160 [Planctomycetaceae bacterium]